MAAPLMSPAYVFENPVTPKSAPSLLIIPNSTSSSLANQFPTAQSSPLLSPRLSIFYTRALKSQPLRVQPSRLTKTKYQLFPDKTPRLLTLPNEILLMIIKDLRLSSPISVLALQNAHPLFYILDSTTLSSISWRQIPRQSRKEEYSVAEKCFAEGFLGGLFRSGKMPCYRCLEVKGKSCFSRDVREGNLAIGAEAFGLRKCQNCGGTDRDIRTAFLKSISSIWGTNLPAQKLPI